MVFFYLLKYYREFTSRYVSERSLRAIVVHTVKKLRWQLGQVAVTTIWYQFKHAIKIALSIQAGDHFGDAIKHTAHALQL